MQWDQYQQIAPYSFFTGGVIAAVCTCQVEVVLVAIVTGLVVHFVTKRAVQPKPKSSQIRSAKPAEPIGLIMKDDAIYEPVVGGDTTGENVEMQPSPAYQEIPKYLQQLQQTGNQKLPSVACVCTLDS